MTLVNEMKKAWVLFFKTVFDIFDVLFDN